MPKRVIRLITFVIFITLFMSNIAYAETPIKSQPYDLKYQIYRTKKIFLIALKKLKRYEEI